MILRQEGYLKVSPLNIPTSQNLTISQRHIRAGVCVLRDMTGTLGDELQGSLLAQGFFLYMLGIPIPGIEPVEMSGIVPILFPHQKLHRNIQPFSPGSLRMVFSRKLLAHPGLFWIVCEQNGVYLMLNVGIKRIQCFRPVVKIDAMGVGIR